MNSLLAILMLPFLAFAETYTVQEGDTLSEISQNKLYSPIYGNSGSLRNLLDLNSQIKNPNLIYTSQILIMSPTTNLRIDEKKDIYYIRAMALLGYARLDNNLKNDVEMRAISKLGKGIEVEIGKFVNEKWTLFSAGKYIQYSFEIADSRNLKNDKTSSGNFLIGSIYSVDQTWKIKNSLGYEILNGLTSDGGTILNIEELQSYFIRIEPRYSYSYSFFDLTTFLPLKYSLLGADFESGLEYGVGIEGSKEFHHGKIIGSMQYRFNNIKLDSTQIQNQSLEFSLGYEFEWGN